MKIEHPELRIGKSVKRISLTRFLLSKIVYEPKKFQGRDVLALYTNQLWLEDKCQQDKQFEQAFSGMVGPLGRILQSVRLSTTSEAMVVSKTIQSNLESYLVPKRNYPQWKNKFAGSYEYVSPKPLGVPTKKLPPERYIGIGYRDKGTAKNTAVDGSQSWQEIATAAETKERIQNELKLQTAEERINSCKTINELVEVFDDLTGSRTRGSDNKAEKKDR